MMNWFKKKQPQEIKVYGVDDAIADMQEIYEEQQAQQRPVSELVAVKQENARKNAASHREAASELRALAAKSQTRFGVVPKEFSHERAEVRMKAAREWDETAEKWTLTLERTIKIEAALAELGEEDEKLRNAFERELSLIRDKVDPWHDRYKRMRPGYTC
jgi:hypothetical protein